MNLIKLIKKKLNKKTYTINQLNASLVKRDNLIRQKERNIAILKDVIKYKDKVIEELERIVNKKQCDVIMLDNPNILVTIEYIKDFLQNKEKSHKRLRAYTFSGKKVIVETYLDKVSESETVILIELDLWENDKVKDGFQPHILTEDSTKMYIDKIRKFIGNEPMYRVE